MNDIIELNQLSTTGLSVGQQLLIPSQISEGPSIEGTTISYTVQNGDSLWKISQLCNITIDEIINLNNLQTTVIQPGQILILPGTCNISGGNNNGNGGTNNEPEEQVIKYIVAKNDTLYGIARKYGVTVEELIEYNQLPSSTLTIGQTILIPNTQQYRNYYVQPNDTLYGIARKFNTTVNDLRRINNLTSDILTINQLLLIP